MTAKSDWVWCGRIIPRDEVVFFSQVFTVFVVIVVSLVNLTLGHPNENLWVALLASGVGYILPAPSLTSKHVFGNPSKQQQLGLLPKKHDNQLHNEASEKSEPGSGEVGSGSRGHSVPPLVE